MTIRPQLLLLRLYGFIAGAAILLQLLMVAPGIGSLPAVYLWVFLPVLVVGLPYWVLSGKFRDSYAVLLAVLPLVIGLMWTESIPKGVLLVLSAFAMIAFGAIITDETDWHVICRWFLIGSLLSAAFLFLEWIAPFNAYTEGGNRLGSVFSGAGIRVIEPNQAGTHAAFSTLIGLALLRTDSLARLKRGSQLLVFSSITASGVILLLSQSRGALLAFAPAIGIAFLFGQARRDPRVWRAALAFGTVSVIALASSSASVLDRLTASTATTAGGRTHVWERAIDLLVSGPSMLLFGAGTAGGPTALGEFDPRLGEFLGVATYSGFEGGIPEINAHSSYFEWLLNFGLIGALFALVAIFLACLRAVKVDRGESFAVGQGMITFFLVISVSLIAYRMVGVSIACGGMALGYLYHRRTTEKLVSHQ